MKNLTITKEGLPVSILNWAELPLAGQEATAVATNPPQKVQVHPGQPLTQVEGTEAPAQPAVLIGYGYYFSLAK